MIKLKLFKKAIMLSLSLAILAMPLSASAGKSQSEKIIEWIDDAIDESMKIYLKNHAPPSVGNIYDSAWDPDTDVKEDKSNDNSAWESTAKDAGEDETFSYGY